MNNCGITMVATMLAVGMLAPAVSGNDAEAKLRETIELIQDEEAGWVDRRNAINSLGRDVEIGDNRDMVMNLLVDFMVDPGGEARRHGHLRGAAANVLGNQFGAEAIPVVLEAFLDPETGNRVSLAFARIGQPSVEPLVELMESEDEELRLRVIGAIDGLARNGAAAVGELADALNDESPQIRRAAAAALGSVGRRYHPAVTPPAEAVTALIPSLHDEDPDVRNQAVTSLGLIGSDAGEATVPLSQLLADEGYQLRLAIIDTLTNIGPAAKDAIETLADVLLDNETDAFERLQAAGALGSIRHRSAAPALLASLTDDDQQIIQAALRALSAMPEDASPMILEAVSDDNPSIRRYAIYVLGSMGEKAAESVPKLMQVLDDTDRAVRRNAIDALGRVDAETGSSSERIAEFLTDDDHDTRKVAARSLGMMGAASAHAVPRLIVMLQEGESDDIRWTAAVALGAIGVEDATPVLVEAMSDDSPTVRWAATHALVDIGADALPSLKRAARDEEHTELIDFVIGKLQDFEQ